MWLWIDSKGLLSRNCSSSMKVVQDSLDHLGPFSTLMAALKDLVSTFCSCRVPRVASCLMEIPALFCVNYPHTSNIMRALVELEICLSMPPLICLFSGPCPNFYSKSYFRQRVGYRREVKHVIIKSMSQMKVRVHDVL